MELRLQPTVFVDNDIEPTRPTALEEQLARERALEAERDDPFEQAIIHVIRWFSPDYACVSNASLRGTAADVQDARLSTMVPQVDAAGTS